MQEKQLKIYLEAMIPENKMEVQGIIRVESIKDNVKYKDYSEDLIRHFVQPDMQAKAKSMKETFSNPSITVSFKEAGED